MKIKCYDKYNKQHLVIDLSTYGDEISCSSFSSMYSVADSQVCFRIDREYYEKHPEEHAEDPSPRRWSDLELKQLQE